MTDLTREMDALRDAAEVANLGPLSTESLGDAEDPDNAPEDVCDYELLEHFKSLTGGGREVDSIAVIARDLHENDARFIVAACNAVKPLLDALTRTEQERDAARAAVDKLAKLAEYLCNEADVHKACHECPMWGAEADDCCSATGKAHWAYAPAPVPDAQGDTHNTQGGQ